MAVFRDLDDPANYNESALSDAAIRDLAGRIEFILDESPRFEPRGAAEMEITAVGVTHSCAAFGFHGAPSDPLDFAGAAAKFRRFTRSILTEREQADLIDRVERLERLTKVRPLAKRLRDPWAVRLSR